MRKRRSAPAPAQAREVVIAEGSDFRILFDRETRDYAVEYRGQPVGWRATEAEARRLVEEMRYEDAKRSAWKPDLDVQTPPTPAGSFVCALPSQRPLLSQHAIEIREQLAL